MFASRMHPCVTRFRLLQWCVLLASPAAAYLDPEEFISDLDKPVPTSEVQGVLGRKASLPCDTLPLDPHDEVSMVLWFKEADGEPLYSYDIRGRVAKNPKLWSAPNGFGSRALFRANASPASLLVDDVRASDAGVYRCRVDFKNSPTRNLRLNFSVIIPPGKPIIFDEKRGARKKLLEPYNEGVDLLLLCEVEGGNPRPKVTWYLENAVIDDSFEAKDDNVTINSLTFRNVGRQHLNSRLICQASNTNLAQPQSRVLILDVNLRPLTVEIISKEARLSADRAYEVECRTQGSRPEAQVTWWKGSKQLKKLAKNFSENNGTLSVLTLTPSPDDDGVYLVCRAENQNFADSAIEDRWKLNVQYVPVVALKLGSNLNAADIKEGDDVYFECNVRANPRAYRLHWYKNGVDIHHNTSAGIILSDQSLVLQSVKKTDSGNYGCVATNSEGRGTSNPVSLVVKYAPICKENLSTEIYGALKHETVVINCEVDANPAPVAYQWTFNNSGDQSEISTRLFTTSGYTSTLNYTPSSEIDYGTLACWGINTVGQQKVPCYYQVVAAARPFPPQNCTVSNQTEDTVHVECVENFDGGLPQWFLMEILEFPSLKVKGNVSTNKTQPHFEIHGLVPEVVYRLQIYSVNVKGKSDVVAINTMAPRRQDKYTGEDRIITLSPMLVAIAATSAFLTAVVCGVLGILYRKHSTRNHHNLQKHVPVGDTLYMERTGSYSPSKQEVIDLYDQPKDPFKFIANEDSTGTLSVQGLKQASADETDPDIIPSYYDRRPLSSADYVTLQRKSGASSRDITPDSGIKTQDNTLKSSMSQQSMTRMNRGVTANSAVLASSLPAHRAKGEVVTTSGKVRESCI